MSNIHTFWAGPINSVIAGCMRSFARLNGGLNVWTFDNNLQVPVGCIVRRADEILDESYLYKQSVAGSSYSYSPFSDWFRYTLMLKIPGAIWIDADNYCLQKYDFEPGFVATEMTPDDKIVPTSCVLNITDKEWLEYASNYCASVRGQLTWWSQTGPALVGQNQTMERKPSYLFCPINYWDSGLIRSETDPLSSFIEQGSYSIHLWNECLQTNNTVCAENSLMDKIISEN